MPENTKRSLAAELLGKVIATGCVDTSQVAARLATSTATLEAYLDGTTPIPLDRQLRLAALVIEKVPPLARAGYRLRGQATAAKLYEQQETAVHKTAPACRFR